MLGNGDGTFAAPVTFNLDYQRDSAYRNSHNTLKTSDVNGDRRTDLITSAGAIVLNVPVAANRAPTVNAGPDRIVDDEGFARVVAAVADPDNDFVSAVWRNQAGQVIADYPAFCGQFDETTTLTVTVTDARGASATDSVLVFLPEGDPPLLVGILNLHEGRTISRGVPFTIEWAATDDPRLHTLTVASSSNDGQTWTTIPGCASGAQVGLAVSSHVDGQLATATFDNVTIDEVPFWRCEGIGAVGVPGRCSGDSGVDTIEGSGTDIWGTADAFKYKYARWFSDGTITVRVRSLENTNASAKAGVMFRESTAPGSKQNLLVGLPVTSRNNATLATAVFDDLVVRR